MKSHLYLPFNYFDGDKVKRYLSKKGITTVQTVVIIVVCVAVIAVGVWAAIRGPPGTPGPAPGVLTELKV